MVVIERSLSLERREKAEYRDETGAWALGGIVKGSLLIDSTSPLPSTLPRELLHIYIYPCNLMLPG